MLYETANLPEAARSRVIGHVVDRARQRQDADRRPWTPAETRRAVKTLRQVGRMPPEAAGPRQGPAAPPGVGHPDADGMAWISACIRDLDAHRIYHRLTAAGGVLEADHPSDDRDADQRRADLFVALLLGHGTNPDHSDSGDAGDGCTDDKADPGVGARQGDPQQDGRL